MDLALVIAAFRLGIEYQTRTCRVGTFSVFNLISGSGKELMKS